MVSEKADVLLIIKSSGAPSRKRSDSSKRYREAAAARSAWKVENPLKRRESSVRHWQQPRYTSYITKNGKKIKNSHER